MAVRRASGDHAARQRGGGQLEHRGGRRAGRDVAVPRRAAAPGRGARRRRSPGWRARAAAQLVPGQRYGVELQRANGGEVPVVAGRERLAQPAAAELVGPVGAEEGVVVAAPAGARWRTSTKPSPPGPPAGIASGATSSSSQPASGSQPGRGSSPQPAAPPRGAAAEHPPDHAAPLREDPVQRERRARGHAGGEVVERAGALMLEIHLPRRVLVPRRAQRQGGALAGRRRRDDRPARRDEHLLVDGLAAAHGDPLAHHLARDLLVAVADAAPVVGRAARRTGRRGRRARRSAPTRRCRCGR